MKDLRQLKLFEPAATYRATCLRLIAEGRMPTWKQMLAVIKRVEKDEANHE